MSSKKTKPDDPTYAWIGVVVVILICGATVSHCSKTVTDPSKLAATQFAENTSQAIAAQGPAPVEPLNAASVKLGTAEARVAMTAEGISGAMIFSQNCYEGLTHTFTWARLDVCGAADMLATKSVDDNDAVRTTEAGYFDSETAAGRYLAAATGAGEDAAEADVRLQSLQASVKGRFNLQERDHPVTSNLSEAVEAASGAAPDE